MNAGKIEFMIGRIKAILYHTVGRIKQNVEHVGRARTSKPKRINNKNRTKIYKHRYKKNTYMEGRKTEMQYIHKIRQEKEKVEKEEE